MCRKLEPGHVKNEGGVRFFVVGAYWRKVTITSLLEGFSAV
jgi:hypothetical protein